MAIVALLDLSAHAGSERVQESGDPRFKAIHGIKGEQPVAMSVVGEIAFGGGRVRERSVGRVNEPLQDMGGGSLAGSRSTLDGEDWTGCGAAQSRECPDEHPMPVFVVAGLRRRRKRARVSFELAGSGRRDWPGWSKGRACSIMCAPRVKQ